MSALPSEYELIRPDLQRGRFRGVLFDFDGTLSLIRAGWPEVMIPLMVETLRTTGTSETDAELTAAVEEFVMRLNGRQTIYQMMQLADEVRQRGGKPEEPLVYKHRYHDRLMALIQTRLDDLASGKVAPEEWTVPGSHGLLQALADRGVPLYLASGTDLTYVKREAELLDVAKFFGEHIYGALDRHQDFSKKMVVDKIIRDHSLLDSELLGFGDGYVEIEELRKAGGVAVAVASDEEARRGINPWKRDRLVRAGADLVIPEYRDYDRLVEWLFAR